MIPVYQTLTTENDGKGNCFIACVASIMELPLREMPDLASDLNGGQYFIALESWLAFRGLFPNYHDTAPKGWSVAAVYLGEARLPHAVVAYNGTTVHDPYPLGGDFVGVGSFWTIAPITDAQRPYCEELLASVGRSGNRQDRADGLGPKDKHAVAATKRRDAQPGDQQ